MQKRVQIKMLTDSYALLKKAQNLIQEGKSESADDLFEAELTRLKQQLDRMGRSDIEKEMVPHISQLIRMEQEIVIYEDDKVHVPPGRKMKHLDLTCTLS